jgi:hypothetical protein
MALDNRENLVDFILRSSRRPTQTEETFSVLRALTLAGQMNRQMSTEQARVHSQCRFTCNDPVMGCGA